MKDIEEANIIEEESSFLSPAPNINSGGQDAEFESPQEEIGNQTDESFIDTLCEEWFNIFDDLL